MSKRNKLKSLIKECLVEILNEGLIVSEKSILENKTFNVPSKKENLNRITRDHLKNFKREENHIEEKINNITTDSVMHQMLMETANSQRYQEQQSAEGQKKGSYIPGDSAAQAMYNVDPTDVFDGAGNWAALAFSNKVK